MAILETKKVCRNFGGLRAVRDLSLAFEDNTINALIGPNGAGKTTIFNLLTGFLPVSSGEVWFSGQRIDSLPPDRIARRKIARTFQMVRVFGGLTVLENIMLGCRSPAGESILGALLRLPSVSAEADFSRAKARQLLGVIGLTRHEGRLARDLAYGEQKLVEIARALATDADVLLLDEPMAGLSHDMVRIMVDVIQNLKGMGKTILLVEHNMSVVMDISDRIFVINYGQEIARGTSAEVRANEAVINAYLGTSRQ